MNEALKRPFKFTEAVTFQDIYLLMERFRESIMPAAEEDIYTFLAQQAAYFYDFSTMQKQKLFDSPINIALSQLKKKDHIYADIIFAQKDNRVHGIIHGSNESFIETWFNNDEVSVRDEFTEEEENDLKKGFVANSFFLADFMADVDRVIAKIPRFDIRVTELALNLMYTAYSEDNKDPDVMVKFTEWISKEGADAITQKRKDIEEVLVKELKDSDLISF